MKLTLTSAVITINDNKDKDHKAKIKKTRSR